GAGDIGYDRHVSLSQGVDQGTLAGVGCADDRDMEAVAEDLAATPVIQMRLHLVCETRDISAALVQRVLLDLLLGNVDGSLDPGGRANQLTAPLFVKPAERSLQLPDRLTPLSLGLGIHQIRYGLRLR